MFKDMGLVRRGHHLLYGHEHGWGRWLPMLAKRLIVHIFNHATCFLLGHDPFGPFEIEGHKIDKKCTACSKKWKD